MSRFQREGTSSTLVTRSTMKDDLVYRLRKRAEIRRSIITRKSVQERKPDRIADLLEEAADALEEFIRGERMCDCREIKRIKLSDGTILENPLRGVIDRCGYDKDSKYKSFDDVKEPGLYFIPASGSFHQYYDGANWLWEDEGWEVVEAVEHDIMEVWPRLV